MSSNQVSEVINSLNNSSLGHDELPLFVAKACIDEFIEPITHMINESLKSGVLLSELKLARVQWCSGGGATGAIAPVPIFPGGAALQFLFHLFLVNFAYILQKLSFDLDYYW